MVFDLPLHLSQRRVCNNMKTDKYQEAQKAQYVEKASPSGMDSMESGGGCRKSAKNIILHRFLFLRTNHPQSKTCWKIWLHKAATGVTSKSFNWPHFSPRSPVPLSFEPSSELRLNIRLKFQNTGSKRC